MSFLNRLQVACDEGRAKRRKCASRILQEFKAECVDAAQEGFAHCEFMKTVPMSGIHEDVLGGIVEELKEMAKEEFGNDVAVTLEPAIRKIGLSKKFPIPDVWETEMQSSLQATCPICREDREVVALTPCGHVICPPCHAISRGRMGPGKCPTCRREISGHQNLFVP